MKKFTREQKLPAIRAVQEWFLRERDEEIGDLGAELLIDALAPTVGHLWYNEAIHDARAVMAANAAVVDEELFALEQLPEKR